MHHAAPGLSEGQQGSHHRRGDDISDIGGGLQRIQQGLRQRQRVKAAHSGGGAVDQQIKAVKGVRQRGEVQLWKASGQAVMQQLQSGRILVVESQVGDTRFAQAPCDGAPYAAAA